MFDMTQTIDVISYKPDIYDYIFKFDLNMKLRVIYLWHLQKTLGVPTI